MSVTNTTEQARRDPLSAMAKLAIFGGTGAAIEMQEAAGQFELVTSAVLPTKGLESLRSMLEANGGAIGEPVKGDEIFTEVKLPTGWGKRSTDHSMWSKLVDEKGRERAGIFYKAAFYDRSAHIQQTRRFGIDRYSHDVAGECKYSVTDACGEVTFSVDGKFSSQAEEWPLRDRLESEVTAHIKGKFPLWEDANQYWD